MRRNWPLLLFGLTLIAQSLFSSCTNRPSLQEQVAQEFFTTASEYLHEFSSITSLTNSRLAEAENLMRDGEIDMKGLDTRFHEIYFAEATTIAFLDNLPEYSSLYDVMWEDGKPPEFICDSDDYFCQNNYKQQHALALNNVGNYILKLEKDLGIKLQYQPAWNTDSPSDNKTQENSGVLDLWIELQSIEGSFDNLPNEYTSTPPLPANEPKVYIKQGNTYLEREEWIKAIDEYTQALELDFDSAEALIGRAIANTWAGNYKRAENDFNEAYDLSYERLMGTDAYLAWGITIAAQYNSYSKLDEADYLFRRVISDTPNNPDAYTGRALTQLKQAFGDTIEVESIGFNTLMRATSNFEKAIELDYEGIQGRIKRFNFDGDMAFLPNYIKANKLVGAVLITTDIYISKGFEPYNRVLSVYPDDVEALIGRGTAHIILEQYDLAVSDFSKAIKLAPDNAHAFAGRAIAYSIQDNHNSAAKDFERVLQIDNGYGTGQCYDAYLSSSYFEKENPMSYDNAFIRTFQNLGDGHLRDKNYDLAIKSYTLAVEVDYWNNDREYETLAYVGRAKAYSQAGAYEKAIADFETAILVSENEVVYRLGAEYYVPLAVTYFKMDDYESARWSFLEAESFLGISSSMDAEAYLARGITSYYYSINYDELRFDYIDDDFRKVIALAPGSSLAVEADQYRQKLRQNR